MQRNRAQAATFLVTPELKSRLKENKAEILRVLEFVESMRRLQAADIRIAIFISDTDASLQVYGREIWTDSDERLAVAEGAAFYTPMDMFAYIQLQPHERRMLQTFKKKFGGTTEWK